MEKQDNVIKEIRKGNRFTVECVNLNHEGQGICRIDGIKEGESFTNFPIFVDNLLPKEKGIIEITKLSKTYGYANIVTLFKETKVDDHIIPFCKNYGVCGGCNIMHMSYQLQLRFKQQMVSETLKKIGGFEEINVLPVIGMKLPLNYRNKVQVPFRKKGYKTICGFFKRDSHEIVPFDKCYIQPDISTEIINFVKNICNEYKIDGYMEQNNSGLIRHVLVRTNYDLSEIMIVLVLTNKDLPHKTDIVKKITSRYKNVKSIVININNKIGNTILGNDNITIYGSPTITDTLCGLKFNIGVQSFYQVNHSQTEVLYNKAIEMANLQSNDILIDAYCGIGTIGLIASRYVKEVYSVEILEEAIQNAKVNALINKIENVHFYCEKAEKQIVDWYNKGIKATSIIIDPPRKGCDINLISTIAKMKIKKVIYISCDPATLSRDLSIFSNMGYNFSKVQPVDLFCQTSNVENIVFLTNQKI